MKKNWTENELKQKVEEQWNIYNNKDFKYSLVYNAYRQLIKYIKESISQGFEWAKDFFINLKLVMKNRIKRLSEIHILDRCKDYNKIHKTARWFYLMYFYDRNGNFICSKLGTTDKTLYKRASQHLDNYRGSYVNVADVKIVEGWDCGQINPVHIEIDMIEYFQILFPNNYWPNDRFTAVITPEMIEEKIKKWLPIYATINKED